MELQSAVVMFCGPHDEGDQTPTRRIDTAIQVALRRGLPLFVAGDAFGERELERFEARAYYHGVQSVFRAYDARRCTLSDAQAVAGAIVKHDLTDLRELFLATDWWHMDRARAMLDGETTGILGRRLDVIPVAVTTGPRPSTLTFENERQGLEDYLAGTYGQRKVVDPLRHSHIHPS